MSGSHDLGAEALLATRLEQRILPGLDRMRNALAALGRPDESLSSVLIVGTNGKGSTAALLAGILQAHGLRVGLYTSPHLIDVEERIRVDGAAVPRPRLGELVSRLERFPELSYFETLTTAAVIEFAERGVDVAVMEAGLGGRWDASSAVEPQVAMLTNVGTDHQGWLGSGRVAIAAEKAAALRGREAIVGAWDGEVEGVIRASARPGTPLSLASDWASVTADSSQLTADSSAHPPERTSDQGRRCQLSAVGCQPVSAQAVRFTAGGMGGEATLPLGGAHQIGNLALALAGAAALAKHGMAGALRADAVRRGIEGTSWPGRLQWCRVRGRELLVDGAHNLEAAASLAATLDASALSGRMHLLFSCLDDKPLAAMAALLRPRVTGVTVAPIASPRATSLQDLAAAFPGCLRAGSVAAALLEAPTDRPTLVTGSLRLAAEVLAMLGGDDG